MEELSGMISDVHEDVQMQVTEKSSIVYLLVILYFYSSITRRKTTLKLAS